VDKSGEEEGTMTTVSPKAGSVDSREPGAVREKLSTNIKSLGAVTSTTKLLALGLLVVEGVLTMMAVRAEGHDRTLLIIGLIANMLLIFVAAMVLESMRLRARSDTSATASQALPTAKVPVYQYDVFLAAFMASTSGDAQYQEAHKKVMEIKAALTTECKFNVYFAGENLLSRREFDEADAAVSGNLDKLKASRRFVLVYPNNAKSSVLVEAGMALALAKDSIYFVGDSKHLPWLLQKANQVRTAGFSRVKIHDDCSTYENIVAKIKKNRLDLFDPLPAV
jgi:hypothetical protein